MTDTVTDPAVAPDPLAAQADAVVDTATQEVEALVTAEAAKVATDFPAAGPLVTAGAEAIDNSATALANHFKDMINGSGPAALVAVEAKVADLMGHLRAFVQKEIAAMTGKS